MQLRLCKLSDLKDEEIKGFDLQGKHLIAIRKGNEVFVLDGICTHEEYDLANGFLLEDRVICPLHLSQFDIRTGKVVNPPAEKPLRTYSVKIVEGEVYIEL
ncbi:MAG TPA: non-heme iron oxygenase ferredoxin subunit [Geobacterales bacterium]|nr:non-heme iron oxygenase ferredoxin subunit [Geobacterales bacterium]